MRLYVYVDSTLDSVPFYVGVGNARRVKERRRNRHHTRTCRAYGWRRTVLLWTTVPDVAYAIEAMLVGDLRTQRTHDGDIGANLTSGGKGMPKPSPEVKRRILRSRQLRRSSPG